LWLLLDRPLEKRGRVLSLDLHTQIFPRTLQVERGEKTIGIEPAGLARIGW